MARAKLRALVSERRAKHKNTAIIEKSPEKKSK